jgi:hypothetical protein
MVLACSLYPDNSIANAMVQVGSQNNPLTITITDNGQNTTKTFKTEAAALSYANQEIAQGHSVNIGLLQIPNSWITKYPASMGANVLGLLRPCKNMVVATSILNDATEQCASVDGDQTTCALSVYHTGSPTAGLDYAKQVIDYAVAHPFVKPPSILEQVPATPDNSNVTTASNLSNTDQANNTNSDNSTANNSSASNTGINNNTTNPANNSSPSQSNSSEDSLQQSLTQQLNDHSQDSNQDQPSLPPVVEGDDSDN